MKKLNRKEIEKKIEALREEGVPTPDHRDCSDDRQEEGAVNALRNALNKRVVPARVH